MNFKRKVETDIAQETAFEAARAKKVPRRRNVSSFSKATFENAIPVNQVEKLNRPPVRRPRPAPSLVSPSKYDIIPVVKHEAETEQEGDRKYAYE